MKTRLRVLALLLAVGACQRDPPPAPAASAASTPATIAASAPAAGQPIAVDEDLLQRYLRYERDRLLLVRRLIAQLQQKRAAASAPANPAAAAALLAAATAYRSELDRGCSELRARAGLSAPQAEQIGALVDAVIVARLAWQQAGGDAQLASIEQRFRARIATLAADARAPIESEFARLIGEVTALRDAADARRSYGDPAVELVLAHAVELTALREQQVQLGAEL